MNVREELEKITRDVISRQDEIFIVEIIQQGEKYEIILDGDKAMGIYDVSFFAKEINNQADEKMPDASYSLDIATPGADSPLKLLRQYPKHTGREFQVNLKDNTNFKGKLTEIKDDNLTFEVSKEAKAKKNAPIESKTIEFNSIQEASIILSFK